MCLDLFLEGSNWNGWTDRQWEIVPKRRGTRVTSSCACFGFDRRDRRQRSTSGALAVTEDKGRARHNYIFPLCLTISGVWLVPSNLANDRTLSGFYKLIATLANQTINQSINQTSIAPTSSGRAKAQWRDSRISVQQQTQGNSSVTSTAHRACRYLWAKGQVKDMCV